MQSSPTAERTRLILGIVEDRGADCVLIETNLDDTNPEFLGR